MFTAIFVTLFVLGWLACGTLVWLACSVVTRGQAGLWYLPLCWFASLVAGLAVPILGKDDADGIWISLLVASATPAVLMLARLAGARALAGSSQGSEAAAAGRPAPE